MKKFIVYLIFFIVFGFFLLFNFDCKSQNSVKNMTHKSLINKHDKSFSLKALDNLYPYNAALQKSFSRYPFKKIDPSIKDAYVLSIINGHLLLHYKNTSMLKRKTERFDNIYNIYDYKKDYKN